MASCPTSLVVRKEREKGATFDRLGRQRRQGSPQGPSVFDSSHNHSFPSGEECSQLKDHTEAAADRRWQNIPGHKLSGRESPAFQMASESPRTHYGILTFPGHCRRCL